MPMQNVRRKAQSSGLDALALSMVLPHEHKPMRFPVVPATLTALLDTMSDGTLPVADGTSRRAFLCRDPSYPLWVERSYANTSGYLQANGGNFTWSIPASTNRPIPLPNWDTVVGTTNAGTQDGVPFSSAQATDLVVLGNAPSSQAIYIPPESLLSIQLNTGALGVGSGIEVDLGYHRNGEEFSCTVLLVPFAAGFIFTGIPDTNASIVGDVVEGPVPMGFTWIRGWRTTATAPAAAATPVLWMGWMTGGNLDIPSGTRTLYVPYCMPPEFNNSILPYSRTRLNSCAALFTNVTAALSKEGTILASRLKQSVVEPWEFTTSHINSVHPTLRYFGPLEKGLYTFTTPSGNVDNFDDCYVSINSTSSYNSRQRPLFQYRDVGVYNAIVFSDLGSANTGTQLATSLYTHLEFESVSSLFTPGVSNMPLEHLHAAEVALLRFGHFHENPVHWAVLTSAVHKAMNFVAPMVMPVVRSIAAQAINRGASYLVGKVGGDRTMPQASLQEKPKQKSKPKPKPKAKRGKR